MSKLAQDAAQFKSVLARQDFTSWHSQPKTSSPPSPPPADSGKKKRPKSDVVWSQPADTGTGIHVNTQLVYAVNHLKQTRGFKRLQDLAIETNTPLDSDPVLLEKFRNHDCVEWNPKTDLYSYKHEFNFRNKAELLTEIQRASSKGGGGLNVRGLKEAWKDAPAAIEDMEKEGDVLVIRTAKDGQLRTVFWNEIKPQEESGGLPVEKEFMDLWHTLKVPNEVDLLKQLASEGLQVTASTAAPVKAPTTKKKGKRGGAPRQRQVKITNTHLNVDLSKDYVAK